MREVDFSDRTVARRWREIKSHLREDLIPWTRHLLKRLLEGCLEEGLETQISTPSGGDALSGNLHRSLDTTLHSSAYRSGTI